MFGVGLGLPALAVVFACGYLLHRVPFWKLIFSEEPGYSLYFRVLILGLFWLFLFSIIARFIPEGYKEIQSFDEALLAGALVAAIVARYFLVWIYNLFHFFRLLDSIKEKRLQKSNHFFELHIYSASIKKRPLMATLQSGKVYIGFVEAMNDQEQAGKWINMLPLYSGSRNAVSQRLTIHTYYDKDRAAETGDGTTQNFHYRVTLPADKIVSLQDFDMKIYKKKFLEEEEAAPTPAKGAE